MRLLVRAPDHLGDGVMALPAIAAVAALGPTVVAGPRWAAELYRHLPVSTVGVDDVRATPADLAVLFKPSLSAALAVRHVPRRVGLASDGRRWLLSTAVAAGGHRIEEGLRIARAAGAVAEGLPSYPSRPEEAPNLPSDAVLLVPGTASPATVRWTGFTALAQALGPRAVFAGGPADQGVCRELAGGARVLLPLSIPAFAAACVRVCAVVGNDSGLPHLAAAARRAAGVDVGAVHVMYASTDPARTGPVGSTAWAGPRPACWPCYKKSCGIGTPCRGGEVGPVLATIEGMV